MNYKKMHLILVQELGKKDAVINAIKRSFDDKEILRYGTYFYGEIDLYDSNSNTLIDFKNQHLISHLSIFCVKAVLDCYGEKRFVSFNIHVFLEQNLNEKIIDIYVEKFENKQLVIDGIKKSLVYKQNITDNGIELINGFEFMDFLNTTITNDNLFWCGAVITVKAFFKFDDEFRLWMFKIKLARKKSYFKDIVNNFKDIVNIRGHYLFLKGVYCFLAKSQVQLVKSLLTSCCEFIYHKISNNYFSSTQETNFILDLDDVDNQDPILTSRGWKGTLLDLDSMNMFLNSKDSPYASFDKEQSEFIEKFTRALHLPASKESSKKFDNFLSQKRFLTFNDLVNTINNHNLNSCENSYIDVPLELIRDHAIQPNLFENTMLKIYNVLSSFFGKNYGYKILRTLAITRKELDDETDMLGRTYYDSKNICMSIEKSVIKKDKNKPLYDRGCFIAPNMYAIFVYEFGHVVDDFRILLFEFRENVDNFSGLNNKWSFETNVHNRPLVIPSCLLKIVVQNIFEMKNLNCDEFKNMNFNELNSINDAHFLRLTGRRT